jgi:signal transduction histidine kinase
MERFYSTKFQKATNSEFGISTVLIQMFQELEVLSCVQFGENINSELKLTLSKLVKVDLNQAIKTIISVLKSSSKFKKHEYRCECQNEQMHIFEVDLLFSPINLKEWLIFLTLYSPLQYNESNQSNEAVNLSKSYSGATKELEFEKTVHFPFSEGNATSQDLPKIILRGVSFEELEELKFENEGEVGIEESSEKMTLYSFKSNNNFDKFLSLRENLTSPGTRMSYSEMQTNKTQNTFNPTANKFSHEVENRKDGRIKELEDLNGKLTIELKASSIYLNMIIHDFRNPVMSLEDALDTISDILMLDSHNDESEIAKSVFDSHNSSVMEEGIANNLPLVSNKLASLLKNNIESPPIRNLSRRTSSIPSPVLYSIKSFSSDSRFFTIESRLSNTPRSDLSRRSSNNVFNLPDLRKDFYLSAENKEQLIVVVKGAKLCSFILTNLINDLLDSAKINKNTFQLFKENTDLHELITTTRQILLFQAKLKNIDLRLDLGERKNQQFLDKVYLDANRMRQVIINLISNALKFTMKNGMITITLRVTEAPSKPQFKTQTEMKTPSEDHKTEEEVEVEIEGDGDGERDRDREKDGEEEKETNSWIEKSNMNVIINCKISDTGVGIAENNLSKLFTDFSTLDEHSLINHEGTGLGLSICKKIIQKMGGQIHASSTLGVGSQFSFTIPALYNYFDLNNNNTVSFPIKTVSPAHRRALMANGLRSGFATPLRSPLGNSLLGVIKEKSERNIQRADSILQKSFTGSKFESMSEQVREEDEDSDEEKKERRERGVDRSTSLNLNVRPRKAPSSFSSFIEPKNGNKVRETRNQIFQLTKNSKINILIVDDSDLIRNAEVKMVKKICPNVQYSDNG